MPPNINEDLMNKEEYRSLFKERFDEIKRDLNNTKYLKRYWGSNWQQYIGDRISQWTGEKDDTLDIFYSLHEEELIVSDIERAISRIQMFAQTAQQKREWKQRLNNLANWNVASDRSAIFEILSLNYLLTLVGESSFRLYPTVSVGNNPSTIDSSIVIDDRDIFIEITAHNTREDIGPGFYLLSDRLGLPLKTAIRKKKNEPRQLGLVNDKPNVVIYSGCGIHQRIMSEDAIYESLEEYRSLSAIIYCSAYYFPKGIFYLNSKAEKMVRLTGDELSFFNSNYYEPRSRLRG